ncbi:hypothetical protein QTP86_025244, partial [Hemibagrus guttatus]
MAKVVGKKLHWRSKVQESFVPLLGSSGELGVAIGGGADYGEFPFVTAAPGGGITVGEIILEIGGTPVLGMTLGDVRGVLNSCPHPIRIKTVTPDSTLCKDLRLYLSKCFTPGCMDSQLQQVIRENLYLRAVPCTTRQPRDGEISGVDYNFVSVEEFFSLEESGALLESGKFKGNYYGTPRPIHIGPDSPPITYQEHRKLLRNFRTRSKSLSNLEKAAEEGYNSEGDSGLSELTHRSLLDQTTFLAWMLRECAEQIVDVFNGIFNISLSSAVVPTCLKATTIVPVPKKSTASCLNDYHPVAPTPIVMKCFERLVMRHIKTQLPPSLDPFQFAYRPNRSTDDAITTTLHLSLTHLDNKDTYVRMLFIEFSSAFNTIIPQHLIEKLSLLGLNTSLCNWILDFLTGRPQSVRIGNSLSSTTTLSTGAPQGCVLSPLLFTLLTQQCTVRTTSSSSHCPEQLHHCLVWELHRLGSQDPATDISSHSLSLPVIDVLGGSGGASSVPAPTSSPSQSRDSSGGDGSAFENGSRHRRGLQRAGLETWEMTYSDSGEPYYTNHQPKPTYWHTRRTSSQELVFMTDICEFTDQPSELRGYSAHTRVCKGPRGFGFNFAGGSRPREFLQIYSITPGGPSNLNIGDILVYINDTCVLGTSYTEALEMLKVVPVGQSVDLVVRRGYPMLYNPDGSPRLSRETASQPSPLPTTTQPKAQALLPQSQTLLNHSGLMYNAEGRYPRAYGRSASRFSLDANGNASHYSPPPRMPSSYRYSSEGESDNVRPQYSQRRIGQLQRADLASQSDSEVVSAIGSHRASFIRNHNNNSLYPPSPLRVYSTKSSDSDLSSYAPSPPLSRLPLPQTESGHASISSSPGGGRRYSNIQNGQRSLLTPPTSVHSDGPYFTFGSANSGSPGSSVPSPGGMSNGGGRELVPIALAKCGHDGSLGFSLIAGGQGGRAAVVKRVWDRQQCNGLQPGDTIVKINGADVQSLSFIQVHRILEEHTKNGEVILLVQRGGNSTICSHCKLFLALYLTYFYLLSIGSIYSSISPKSRRQHSPTLPRPASASQIPLTDTPPLLRKSLTPPPQSLVRSSLVQSTSFLDSVPVTLTLEPRDWMSTEEGGTTLNPRLKTEEKGRPPLTRGFEVELRRRPGEGFGFVIASQDVENGRAASLLPHRFVTVRRGSPAARSGLIRPGDRLESVEGRSVVNLPHRELAQILRRAGNTLRLTVVPRASAHSTEHSDSDPIHRSRKPHRSKPKDSSRYYSVELERGPTGFGFSLRGGSEYNMDLYVLGLMEGGPASSSRKMQVSDQLVEINGKSTAGMSHSQAVEQIRTAGHKIHLVLKKGNGYVPDYGHDQGAAVSSLPSALQPHLAAVNHHHRRPNSTSSPPRTGRTLGQRGRTEHQGREESPKRTQVTGHGSKDRRRRQSYHSLPRTIHRGHSDEEVISEPATRGKHKQRETKGATGRRSKSEDKGRQPTNEIEEESQGEEEQQDREQEREEMHMSIHEQRFTEFSKKWNEKKKEKLDTKEGEVQKSLFLHEDESSWGNLG